MVMERDPQTPRNVRPLRVIPAEQVAKATAHRRRLEELKRRIAEGTYEVDAEMIAREIVRRGLDE
jgi:anti-sigma28 factor (negative regulator of flagellin synthesis)